MDKSDNSYNSPMQPDADARKRRKIRGSKPVREWTAAEQCEAFCEACRLERERAEAGIVEDWELCEDCHEYKCESASRVLACARVASMRYVSTKSDSLPAHAGVEFLPISSRFRENLPTGKGWGSAAVFQPLKQPFGLGWRGV